jgi:hypothetical protein
MGNLEKFCKILGTNQAHSKCIIAPFQFCGGDESMNHVFFSYLV